MRARAAAVLVPLLLLGVSCSQTSEQQPDAASTTPVTASSTPSGTVRPPLPAVQPLQSVAQFYASDTAGVVRPSGADGPPLLDETRAGTVTYPLPDVQQDAALTVSFTCSAHVAASVQIGEAGQPGSHDSSSTDCAGLVGAYTTPALDPSHLPRSVSVSVPADVWVSLAVYGVTAQEQAAR